MVFKFSLFHVVCYVLCCMFDSTDSTMCICFEFIKELPHYSILYILIMNDNCMQVSDINNSVLLLKGFVTNL